MRETEIMKRIRGRFNRRDEPTRLWRNNVGKLPDRRGIPLEFGLAVGSSDLVGIERRLVTPEMVGTYVGLFLAIEVKTPKGRLSPEQIAWLGVIRDFGGIDRVMRSEDEADEYLRSIKQ